MVWGGSWEGGSGWGTHVYLWRIHFDIWQNYAAGTLLSEYETERKPEVLSPLEMRPDYEGESGMQPWIELAKNCENIAPHKKTEGFMLFSTNRLYYEFCC